MTLLANFSSTVGLLAAITAAVPANAQTNDSGPAERVLDCREIAADAERLACFDAASDAFSSAIIEGRIDIIDAERVAEAERRGFGLPDFNPLAALSGLRSDNGETRDEFADIDVEQGEVERAENGAIESISELRVVSLEQKLDGKVRVVLANGQVWDQTDTRRVRPLRRDASATATIRRAAMGSFMMTLSHSSGAFRAERVQ